MSLRLALRSLTSQPAATTVVVLTLAVAIASTTVIGRAGRGDRSGSHVAPLVHV